jgi:hypothetical protein
VSGGLYHRLLERVGADLVRWVGTCEEHLELRGAERVLASAVHLVHHVCRGGFALFYYPANPSWQAALADEYWQACRDAARRGRKIVRVYVLQERSQLDETGFLRMAGADLRAGIEALYLLEQDIPSHYPRDFALWDDELYAEACLSPGPGGLELTACRCFQDERHLADARELQRRVLRVAARCTGLPSEEALLRESVVEQRRAALQWCRGDGNGRESCAWYHGSWHLLRACGVVVTPAWHERFFARGIRESAAACIAEKGKAAILISGLADYGMLYHVVAAMGPRLIEQCEIDLLDLCEVPLRMGCWLQERLRRSPAELRVPLRNLLSRNILDGTLPAAGYDLIVSDAFITRFEKLPDKRQVVEEWLRLLAPGGRVVTTIKFCSFFDDFPPSQMWRRRFVERALEKRPAYVPPDELESLADEYARRVHSFPFPDADRIRGFLSGIAGLEVAMFELDEERGDVVGTPFAQVVLRRQEG